MPRSVHRQSVDLPVMRHTNCAADRSDSPVVARGEHAATNSLRVVEVPQTHFINSVFVANRDRDSTGAAPGQVVHKFRTIHRPGRCASGRAEASAGGSTAPCGRIPRIFNVLLALFTWIWTLFL